MRTLQTNSAVSYLTASLLPIGLFVSSTTLAMPLQSTVLTTPKPAKETVLNTKTETSGLKKSAVMARNITSKVEPASTTAKATATAQKNQDKKAVSRCWKRLMNMVREIRHAQNTKSK